MHSQEQEGKVSRVFRFVDILGHEIHTIDDPENKLPVPKIGQVICIGSSRIRVQSVAAKQTDASGPIAYHVRVRLVHTATDQLLKN